MDDKTSSAALLAVTSGISVFNGLLPSLSDVRKATKEYNPDVTNDVRMGEVAASALVIGIGLFASATVNSPIPGMVSVVCALALIAMYESILASQPTEKG